MPEFRNLIGGEWLEGGEHVANVNPSDTDDIVGQYARGDAGQVRQAIDAAREGAPGWRALGIQKRSDILDTVGTQILARKDELGQLLSREEGKTLAEGIGEAARAGQIFKYFAGEALRIRGDLLDSVRPGLSVEITREPVGVVGIITPWNFPIAIPAWKIAPALAYGNTVVFKPAELVPGCAWEIVSMLVEAGLPAGVLNLVMGRGSDVGQAIVDSPDLNAVSFTGSQGVGMDIARTCAAQGKKVQLEMGGKNPLVVLDDADMEKALGAAINGAYFSTGQRCTASSRLIVTAGIHDRFVAALTERMTELRVGHALASDTQIGPVVSQSQLDQNLDYLEIGRKEGASLSGGAVLNRDTPGHFMAPALFTEASNAMRICREEIFGPVAAVIRAADYDEALAIANDTPFGLSAGICTGSLKHASDFKRNSQAGMVMVNLPTAGVDYHVPFGGTKGSSYGSREQGSYAKEFYTVIKTSYTDAG